MLNKLLLTLSLIFFLNVSLDAKSSNSEDMIEHLALATLMIYDARYKKAEEELALVNKKSSKYDEADYYTVVAVLNSKRGSTKKAITAYKKAIKATQTKKFLAPKNVTKDKYLFSIGKTKKKKDSMPKFDAKKKKQEKISGLYMNLTQEYYKLKDYKNTVESLESAGEKRQESCRSLYT